MVKIMNIRRYIFVSIFLVLSNLGITCFAKQVWVDKNGQKIEAEFVRADEESLTVLMFGQEMSMPLDSLSPFSKALAVKMRNEAANGGGSQVPVWTDTQGRNIRAHFIRADASNITLEMNGKTFTLPLEMLDAKSMRQAFVMSQSANPLPPTPPPAPPAPQPTRPSTPVPTTLPAVTTAPTSTSIPTPAEKPTAASTAKGTDPNGPLNLDQPQTWISTDGRPLEAYFLGLKGNELSLKLTGGRELSMPLDKFDQNSHKLAQNLKKLKDQDNQKRSQALAKRKNMKVPEVTEADLEKSHAFKNSEGNAVQAKFIEANDERVVIAMSNNPNRRIPLPWEKFSSESQALLEALRRVKKTMVPKFASGSGNKLPRFTNGKFAGYNSVIETERFDVALGSTDNGLGGVNVRIWLKSEDDSLPPRNFNVQFSTLYTHRVLRKNPDGSIKRNKNKEPEYAWPRARRRITKFDTMLEPSMDREQITLRGTFDNKGTFEYNMELNKKGLLFWSKMKEPPFPKPKKETDPFQNPTQLSFHVSIPGLIQDAKNVTADKMESIVGDAYLSLRPQSGKPRKFPFRDQWTVTKKKFAGDKFGALKSMTVEGFPYGNTKLTAIPVNTSDMSFGYGYQYGMLFPFQGLHFYYSGASERYKQEIPKNRALKILLTEVD